MAHNVLHRFGAGKNVLSKEQLKAAKRADRKSIIGALRKQGGKPKGSKYKVSPGLEPSGGDGADASMLSFTSGAGSSSGVGAGAGERRVLSAEDVEMSDRLTNPSKFKELTSTAAVVKPAAVVAAVATAPPTTEAATESENAMLVDEELAELMADSSDDSEDDL